MLFFGFVVLGASIVSPVFAGIASAQLQPGEVAYKSGQVIKFRNVVYTFEAIDNRSGSDINGWSIYLPAGWTCGDSVIVDNPGAGETVELRDTEVQTQNVPSPALGASCQTIDSDIQPTFVDVDSVELCTEAGGAWAGTTCTFNSNPSTTPQPTEGAPTCEDSGWFSWIQCPLLKASDELITYTEAQIDSLLRTPKDYYDNPAVDGAWARIRNLAYILLIPILLVMVIGTALGFNFFDAYTIKRALPRMLIATIFIALSLPLLQLAMDINTVIGTGIAGLILSAVPGAEDITLSGLFDPSFSESGLIWGGLLIGAFAIPIWIGAATFLAISVVISIFTIFVLLAFRQLLLVALIIFAPLAILSWIFPGNDKLWKLWGGSFWKLMFLYPLIMGLLAVGRIFAVIVRDSGIDGIIAVILILVAYIGPFFLIPAAFKYAGGVFANIGGMVNNRERGMFDRLRKARSNSLKGGWERAQSNTAYKGAGDKGFRGTSNRLLQRASLSGKALKSNGITSIGSLSAGIDKEIRAVKAHELDELLKDGEVGVWRGNDDLSGIAGDVMNADSDNLTAAFIRRYSKAPTKRAEEVAASTAKREGLVEGTDEYNERYESVLNSEKTKFMPSITSRARIAADSVVKMQNSGNFKGALSTALDESGAFLNSDGTVDAEKRNIAVSQVVSAQRKYGNTALARGMVISAMEGGTYYANSEDTWRAAGLAAHGDDNAEADMVVKGRKALQSAGRIEGLGSFGTTLGHMQNVSKDISSSEKERLKSKFAGHLIDNNPGSTLANQALKDKYLEADVIPELQRRITEAAVNVESGVPGAQDKLVQSLVIADSVHQMLGQTKPQMAKVWADKLLSMKLPPMTVQEEEIVNVTRTVKVPSGLFNEKNEPIYTEREIVEQVKQPVTKTVTRSVRQENGVLKNTAEWQKYHKEFYTAEEVAQQKLGSTPEERRAAEEATRLGGGGGDIGGGLPPPPPLGGKLG